MTDRLCSCPNAFVCALCFIWVFSASVCLSQTYVSGPISGVWTQVGSPYVATDTLEVLAGTQLHIQPGVEVLFDGPYAVFIYGRLTALGAESDSITFGPFVAGTEWRGMRFMDADDGCYLSHCRIVHSSAVGITQLEGCGGGIYSENTSLTITHCRITDCSAESFGCLFDGGGAICCFGGSPRIIKNRIVNCYANAFCVAGGGGIWIRGADVLIQGNHILRCWAHGAAGGIGACSSSVDICHNVVAECSGFHYGGGIDLGACEGIIFNNLIVRNDVPDIVGGGIFLGTDNVDVVACTIADNSVGEGEWGDAGGIYVGGDCAIRDCILWGNTAGGQGPQIWPDSVTTVSFCDVEGGYPGLGNFDLDPLFTAGLGDTTWNRYCLSAIAAGQPLDSPCIDAGDCTAAEAGLDHRTTRVDLFPDTGILDLGYHYEDEALASAGRPPEETILARNYPNPFRAQTVIQFRITKPGMASLAVFDVTGRRVTTLLDRKLPAGWHTTVWNGRNRSGERAAPGIYYFRLEYDGASIARPMLLIR